MLDASGQALTLDLDTVGIAGAKRGNLDDFTAHGDMHDAEAATDDACLSEFSLGLFGCGIGRNIEVLGLFAQQKIAHGTAHDIRFITRIVERVEHAQAAGADVFA